MPILKVANIYFNSTGTSKFDITAGLDIRATGNALVLPIGTTAQRPAACTAGMIRYNSTLGLLESYNASAWTPLTEAGSSFVSGTKMIFAQTAAPTGWTKDTTYNDYALRVTTGTVGPTGGSVAFTTAFASQTPSGSISVTTTVSGTVQGTVLTTAQLATHNHPAILTNVVSTSPGVGNPLGAFSSGAAQTTTTNTTYIGQAGSQGSHVHGFTATSPSTGSFTGNAINLAVRYVDVIIATKA